MNQITKYTRLFTLIGIIATIIGYIFLIYKGYTLNEEISDKFEKVKRLNEEISMLEKSRDRLQKTNKEADIGLVKMVSSSKDPNTIKQGEQLIKDLGIPTDKNFTITSKENINNENAKKYEEDGFQFLLDQDVNSAINSFIKSENSYNSYHQVYEIARYLTKNKERLSDKNSISWKEVYIKILSEYSLKMPEQFKIKLQEKVK